MSDPLKPQRSDNFGNWAEKVHDKAFGPSGKIMRSRDFRISYTPGGIVIRSKIRPSPPAAPVPSGSITELSLVAVFGDYTVCRNLDNGSLVSVAKPPDLRNSVGFNIMVTTADQAPIKYVFSYPHNPIGGGPSADPFAYQMRGSTSQKDQTYEEELVTPPYLLTGNVGPNYRGVSTSIVLAIPGKSAVQLDPLDPYQAPLTMIEVGPRAWTFANDQTI